MLVKADADLRRAKELLFANAIRRDEYDRMVADRASVGAL